MSQNQAAAGDAGAPATVDAPAGGDDVATLRAELAELKAARAKDAEGKAAADKAQADKVEADRVAALSADQKRDEELAKQRADLDKTRAGLVADRRSLVLDRLGVADKFKAYAPQVDPGDPAGAKAIEEWAKANPELLKPSSAPGTVSPLSVKLGEIGKSASKALQGVLTGERKSTLVTSRSLSKMFGD